MRKKRLLRTLLVEHMTWDNEEWKPVSGSSYKFYAKTNAGVSSLGWDQMWGSYVYGSLKVTYTGDLTVGVKADAKLINDSDYPSVTYQLDSFEILKKRRNSCLGGIFCYQRWCSTLRKTLFSPKQLSDKF